MYINKCPKLRSGGLWYIFLITLWLLSGSIGDPVMTCLINICIWEPIVADFLAVPKRGKKMRWRMPKEQVISASSAAVVSDRSLVCVVPALALGLTHKPNAAFTCGLLGLECLVCHVGLAMYHLTVSSLCTGCVYFKNLR